MIYLYTWMDYYHTVEGSSPAEYNVLATVNNEETVIFQGKAWPNPETDKIKINISKIVRDYLSTEFPVLTDIDRYFDGGIEEDEKTELEEKYPNISFVWVSNVSQTAYKLDKYTFPHADASKKFTISVYNGEEWESTEYMYVLDYSYDHTSYDDAVRGLYLCMSRPVNGHSNTQTFKFATYAMNLTNPKVRTLVSKITDSTKFRPFLLENKYSDAYCGDYALYYTNKFGGWDSFLFEGQVIKTDSIERHYIEKIYDNTTVEFGNKPYANEMIETWQASTGFLSDKESEIFAFNLLSTNKAYLHDLKKNKIYPVIIKDSTAQHKTFNNQGKKMFTYTVNLESSHTKENLI